MRTITYLIAICGATISQLCPVPAYATSTRTWISRSGNDNNPCSASSPCLSFAGALAKTAAGGEVDCLDAGDYSSQAQTAVTFSVTIDCHGLNATNYNPGTETGIEVNAPGGIVVLRGLTFNGAGSTNSIDVGIYVQAATTVHIEDCTIMGFRYGVADVRTTGLTQLFIKNTVIRGNHVNANSPGIVLEAAPKNSVVLENVQLLSNGYGIAVATGNNVLISRSVISGNGLAGIEADPGAQVYVENTKISHNVSYGIFAGGTVALANSDISFNTTSISGATVSYGNNRLFGNGGGTAPTPVGGASTDFGQQ
jgi:nitrous oxidase accessory protein NosD